jgi:hypothetical protein
VLRINVPSTGPSEITFSAFERYGLPGPRSGADAEINDSIILNFEDEEEAIIYAQQLENLANGLDDKSSAQYLAINDLIVAIRNDEFIQTYNEEN